MRAVVSANSSGVAETVSYTDYYPHGGTLPGRNYQSSLNFPYGYQGQEKDPATGLTNFELRQYDPRIGRWYNPDPYGQHHSPYLAMSNNPVSFTDPDGGWDVDNGFNDNPFGAGLYANSASAHNPDAYGKSEFDRQYNPSGSWRGSIGADGSYTSNETWISGAHANWKASQKSENNDYFETNVHMDSEGGVVGFSDANVVAYRIDPMYDRITKRGQAKDKGFWSDVDDAIGEGLFGKAGYGAVKRNGGNNNPYMFTNDELKQAAEIEMEALSYFIPVGEIFQFGRVGVNWLVSRVGSRVIDLSVKEGGSLFWSGLGEIEVGEKIAETLAISKGFTTLSMKLNSSLFGKMLRNSIDALPKHLQGAVWDKLSQRFAQGVTGSVNILHGSQIGVGSTWIRIERDILMGNGIKPIFH